MAYYLVVAKPRNELLPALLQNLQEDSYVGLRPFGRSLTLSLRGARLREDGYAVWEEEDYCSPPLAQERDAVLDEFFDELTVEKVQENEGWARIQDFPYLFPQLHSPPASA